MHAHVSCFLHVEPRELEVIRTHLVSKIEDITVSTACDMSHATSNHTIVCMIHPNDTRMLLGSELAGIMKKVSETVQGAIEFRRQPVDVIVQLSDKPFSHQDASRAA